MIDLLEPRHGLEGRGTPRELAESAPRGSRRGRKATWIVDAAVSALARDAHLLEPDGAKETLAKALEPLGTGAADQPPELSAARSFINVAFAGRWRRCLLLDGRRAHASAVITSLKNIPAVTKSAKPFVERDRFLVAERRLPAFRCECPDATPRWVEQPPSAEIEAGPMDLVGEPRPTVLVDPVELAGGNSLALGDVVDDVTGCARAAKSLEGIQDRTDELLSFRRARAMSRAHSPDRGLSRVMARSCLSRGS